MNFDNMTADQFVDAVMSTGITESEVETAVVVLGITFLVIVSYAFISWVLSLIARWRVFKKAGEAGWKGIIPVYSKFIQYRLTWNTKMFWIALALIVVGEFLGDEGVIGFIGALMALVGYIINNIVASHKLSKSFGHGVPFTIGLLFFEGLFMLILAFGKSQYLGNTTVPAPAVEVTEAVEAPEAVEVTEAVEAPAADEPDAE